LQKWAYTSVKPTTIIASCWQLNNNKRKTVNFICGTNKKRKFLFVCFCVRKNAGSREEEVHVPEYHKNGESVSSH